jgi:hypothetical protein
MGLTYHFGFVAPATVPDRTLEAFLRRVERDAQTMGFRPTAVINGPFDTPERRDFARRIARGLTVTDPRLRGRVLPEEGYWSRGDGYCRLAPERGVVLILTSERGEETAFGFFRYPGTIRDRQGRTIMSTPGDDAWRSADCVKSPDPRYRSIVRRFAEAGFLDSEKDEFAAAETRFPDTVPAVRPRVPRARSGPSLGI